jgi:hypothetical protein
LTVIQTNRKISRALLGLGDVMQRPTVLYLLLEIMTFQTVFKPKIGLLLEWGKVAPVVN